MALLKPLVPQETQEHITAHLSKSRIVFDVDGIYEVIIRKIGTRAP